MVKEIIGGEKKKYKFTLRLQMEMNKPPFPKELEPKIAPIIEETGNKISSEIDVFLAQNK